MLRIRLILAPVLLLPMAAFILAACQPAPPNTTPARATANVQKPSAEIQSTAVPKVATPGTAAPGGDLRGLRFKVVSSLPHQGPNKGQADSIVNAVRMALEEINSRIQGAEIEYESWDDSTAERGGWDPAKEAENAVRAAGDPYVMAYIGPYNSDAAKVSIPILCQAGLLMVSPSTTYAGLTKPGKGEPGEPDRYYPNGCRRNFLRVITADDIQGPGAAWWSEGLGASRAYILHDGSTYGRAIAELYKNAADPRSLLVVGGPEGVSEVADFRDVGNKIRDKHADIVFYGGTTQKYTGKLWQDLRAVLGRDVKLMGADGIYKQAFVDAAGPAAEGTYATFPGAPPTRLIRGGADWYQRYKSRYQVEPESYAAYGYEAAQVVLQAIRNTASHDRSRIRDAAFATRGHGGVLGEWSFDQNGDTTLRDVSGLTVRGGKFDTANAEPFPAPLETAGRWRGPLEQLDKVWDNDWVRSIQILDQFRTNYPYYSPANNKLYAALVSSGWQLIDRRRQCDLGIQQLARAEELNRVANLGRGEAAMLLKRGC